MKLHINNEFSPLKSVVVCWGENVPHYKDYKTDDPEFIKYHPYAWDKELLLKQQEQFFKKLEQYGIRLVFPKMDSALIWQMYTRDTAFVVGNKLYYSATRKLGTRNGEVKNLLQTLNIPSEQVIAIKSEIEGGDVLVTNHNSIYVGHGSRTSNQAITQLQTNLTVKVFELGDNIMHLDTRLTLLPNNIALICPAAFNKQSLQYLAKKYTLIEVSETETKKLGTNMFVINPETVFVPLQHTRIAKEIEKNDIKVELVDYTEPINLGGSFRCTTLPLERDTSV